MVFAVAGVLVEVAAMGVPNEVVIWVANCFEGDVGQGFFEIVTVPVCEEATAIVKHHDSLSER